MNTAMETAGTVLLNAGLFAPLAVTSRKSEPELTAVGFLLQLNLMRLTVTGLKGAGNAVVERTARIAGTITSPANRGTRVALGAAHVLAAASYAERSHRPARRKASSGDSEATPGLRVLGQAFDFTSCVVLWAVAGVYLSTAYYGQ